MLQNVQVCSTPAVKGAPGMGRLVNCAGAQCGARCHSACLSEVHAAGHHHAADSLKPLWDRWLVISSSCSSLFMHAVAYALVHLDRVSSNSRRTGAARCACVASPASKPSWDAATAAMAPASSSTTSAGLGGPSEMPAGCGLLWPPAHCVITCRPWVGTLVDRLSELTRPVAATQVGATTVRRISKERVNAFHNKHRGALQVQPEVQDSWSEVSSTGRQKDRTCMRQEAQQTQLRL